VLEIKVKGSAGNYGKGVLEIKVTGSAGN